MKKIFVAFLMSALMLTPLISEEKETENVVEIDNIMYQNEPFDMNYYEWDDAKCYCQRLTFAGYSDWRLPNKKELTTLKTEEANQGQERKYYIRKEFVENLMGYPSFWTSEEKIDQSSRIWHVCFFGNYDHWGDKSSKYYTMCVRET